MTYVTDISQRSSYPRNEQEERMASLPHNPGPQRAPDATAGSSLDFELAAEIEKLRREPAYESGRNAKTMVKYEDFRIVLTAIRGGARIQEHHSAGRISVQTVAGHIRMRALGSEFDLPQGRLLVLDRGVQHNVEAVQDSAFLLTVAWPK
jgi:quercetin dioxygenase-like cupin family protein